MNHPLLPDYKSQVVPEWVIAVVWIMLGFTIGWICV